MRSIRTIESQTVRDVALRMLLLAGIVTLCTEGAEEGPGAISYRLSSRAYPKGVKTEQAYAQGVDEALKTLHERAATAKDRSLQARLLLAAANLRLARRAEPFLTKAVLGDDSQAVRRDLGATARKALQEARRASELLGAKPAPVSMPKGDPVDLSTVARTMRIFASSLLACAEGKEVDQAISALKPLVESKRSDTAKSAQIVRALLRMEASRFEEALSALPPALEAPKELPWDFFLRILRCRVLAEQQRYAMAGVLLLRMEAECEKWLDKSRLAVAQRAIARVRIDVANRWARELEAKKLLDHAARRKDVAEALARDHFSDGTVRVYRLNLAVPILIEAPPPAKPKPEPRPRTTTTSRPASAPSDKASKPATRPVPTTSEVGRQGKTDGKRRSPTSKPSDSRPSE